MTTVDGFLQRSGWAGAARGPLAGDASSRSYERLTGPNGTAVLMHDPQGDVALFARLARHLNGIGLSAPEIMAEDAGLGLLLTEDFGDGLVARLCEANPADEVQYYAAAGTLLAHLHRQPLPDGLVRTTPEALGQATDLAFHFYCSDAHAADARAAQCAALFARAIAAHAPNADVLVLRDFHAENLIWLPGREGVRRLGLLDFQDALIGHHGYDLVSLIQDARRDVSDTAAKAAIESYLSGTATPGFEAALAVLGAQRNLRILGIFARLAQVAGKPRYIDLIPRVWAHLQSDLSHPALKDIRAFLDPHLPAPTLAHLTHLRTACPTP